MINVKDLKKVYEETMSERDKNIVEEFENFIDKQLIKNDGKSRITEWDFLMIVDKAIGGLTTKDYLVYKKAFECVEDELNIFEHMTNKNECAYTEEAMLLRYMLERYYHNGYFIRFSWRRIIRIEK